MIRLASPPARFRSKFCVVPGEGFHAKCKLIPGTAISSASIFLRGGRVRVTVGDDGPDLEVIVKPEDLVTRRGRKYVRLLVDDLNFPKQPGEYYLLGLWSAINRDVRDHVPGAWIIRMKLEDPFPPIKRD